MTNSNPPNDPSQQHELIVAYLDGELSPQESEQVEHRLAADEQFREQLQGFDRVWAALDQLPGVTVDDKFSRTTMEMVVSSARREVQEQTAALPVQRRKRGLATALLAATAGLLGFLLFRLVWDDPNKELLADLPAIEFVDVYSQFQEVAFLRKLRPLAEQGGWRDDQSGAELQQRLDQFAAVAPPARRKAWVQQLSADEKVMLRAKFHRFRSLPAQQKERIRKLHTEIVGAEDAADLQETMLLYRLSLNDLPPSEQFELREMSPEQRVSAVSQLVEQNREPSNLKLTDEQLLALAGKIYRRMRASHPQMANHLKNLSPRELEEWKRKPVWRKLHILMQQESDSASRYSAMRELYEVAIDSLPEEVKAKFQQLPRTQQREQIMRWIRHAHALKSEAGKPARASEQALEDFFAEELDVQERERLLAMPRDEMQRELLRLYRGGQPDPPWARSRGEGRGPGRGHGPPSGRPGRDYRRGGPPDSRRGPGRGPKRPPPEDRY